MQYDCTVKTKCVLRHVLWLWIYSTHFMQSIPLFFRGDCSMSYGKTLRESKQLIPFSLPLVFIYLFLFALDKWFTPFILKCLDWFCNAIKPIKVCLFKLCKGFGVFICQSVWVRTKNTVKEDLKGRKAIMDLYSVVLLKHLHYKENVRFVQFKKGTCLTMANVVVLQMFFVLNDIVQNIYF